MSMPVEVMKWLDGASRVRMRRDIELATVHANANVPLHERHDWMNARTQEAAFKHDQRMADAAKAWPAALAEFEQSWCQKKVMEFDGGYGS